MMLVTILENIVPENGQGKIGNRMMQNWKRQRKNGKEHYSDKLAKAQGIVRAINNADLEKKVSDLRETLYCGLTDAIPAELLAPEEIKGDETENFAS